MDTPASSADGMGAPETINYLTGWGSPSTSDVDIKTTNIITGDPFTSDVYASPVIIVGDDSGAVRGQLPGLIRPFVHYIGGDQPGDSFMGDPITFNERPTHLLRASASISNQTSNSFVSISPTSTNYTDMLIAVDNWDNTVSL